jgi:hypothetical protein
MTLTTHWLGSDTDWVITKGDIPGDEATPARPKWVLSSVIRDRYLRRVNSRSVAVSRLAGA